MNQHCTKILRPTLVVAALLISLLGAGCGKGEQPPKTPRPQLSLEKFARLYAESLTIRNSTLPPRERETLLVQLYTRYGLTRDEYERTQAYYKTHPGRWQKVLQLAERYLTSQKKKQPIQEEKTKSPELK